MEAWMNSSPNATVCTRGIAGRYYRAEIHHQPWALQRASLEIRANSMAEPIGLALPMKPDLCHFSRSLKMLAWAPQIVRLTGSEAMPVASRWKQKVRGRNR